MSARGTAAEDQGKRKRKTSHSVSKVSDAIVAVSETSQMPEEEEAMVASEGEILDSEGSFLTKLAPAASCNVTPQRGRGRPRLQTHRPRKRDKKEPCTSARKARRSLSLHGSKEKKEQKPEKVTPQKDRGYCARQNDGTKNAVCVPVGPKEDSEVKPEQRQRQTMVPYLSPSSSDDGDTGPWLMPLTVSPPCFQSSTLSCLHPGTPNSAGHLGLSPSLLSSPVDHVLQGFSSSQELFEDVLLSSSSSDVQDSPRLVFTMDHSYQSHKGGGIMSHKPQSRGKITRKRRVKLPLLQMHSPSSNDESDISVPSRLKYIRKRRRSQKYSHLNLIRKKCVNGFIMFCRINRKLYLSARPGIASTAATKGLAELWREMSAQERRPYCVKALQFSLLHGRLVKERPSQFSHEDLTPPKPLSMLLAEKASSHVIP
ncbi:meiosis initiator protein [Bombina bombina]|uniref:meiosis initiator protein n=1 Tax=Bombina bombina TaxID=8345 RepID=UPI00235A75E2|nr:meiosis initiator protein [Bombina bombina]